MPPYLTFTTAKVKIKLPSYFFPNSHSCYETNFDEYKDTDPHWVALFCNKKQVIYFDSFGVKHVPKEI